MESKVYFQSNLDRNIIDDLLFKVSSLERYRANYYELNMKLVIFVVLSAFGCLLVSLTVVAVGERCG